MVNFIWAISASLMISLISLIGIFSILLQGNLLERILILLIGFSAGGLIGGAFLHLLPEALEQASPGSVFLYTIAGFVFFFIMERYLHWRHCHQEHCKVHPFTYLNLIGDGIHNFIDGLVIGASFIVSVKFGVITTLVVVFHEIPQEIGDFGILVYGGFTRSRALAYNFVSALTCVVGTAAGYYLGSVSGSFSSLLLPITAGGFLYIAACDLIPELHKEPGLRRASVSAAAFICGILFILLTRLLHSH